VTVVEVPPERAEEAARAAKGAAEGSKDEERGTKDVMQKASASGGKGVQGRVETDQTQPEKRPSWSTAVHDGKPLDPMHFIEASRDILGWASDHLTAVVPSLELMIGEAVVAQAAVDPGFTEPEKGQLLKFLFEAPFGGAFDLGSILGIAALPVPGSNFTPMQIAAIRAAIHIFPRLHRKRGAEMMAIFDRAQFGMPSKKKPEIKKGPPNSQLKATYKMWQRMLSVGKRRRLNDHVAKRHDGDEAKFVREFIHDLELMPGVRDLAGPIINDLVFHALNYFLGARGASFRRLQMFRGFYYLGQQVAQVVAKNNRNVTFWLIDNILMPWLKEGQIPTKDIVWDLLAKMREALESIQAGRFLTQDFAVEYALKLHTEDPQIEFVVTKLDEYYYVWRGGPKSTLIRGERILQIHPYGHSATPSIGDVIFADVGTRDMIISQHMGTLDETSYIKINEKMAWGILERRHKGKVIERQEGFFIYPHVATGENQIIGRLFVPLAAMRMVAQGKGWQPHGGNLYTSEMTTIGLQNGTKEKVPFQLRQVMVRGKTYMIVYLSTNPNYPPILFEGDLKRMIRLDEFGVTEEFRDKNGIALILPWEDSWINSTPDFTHIPRPAVTGELTSVETSKTPEETVNVIGNLTQAATTIMSHDYIVRHGNPTAAKRRAWNRQVKSAAISVATILDFIVDLDPVAKQEYIDRLNMQWGDHIPALPTLLETVGQLTDRHFDAKINGGQRLHDITEKEQ